jgi:hypothetical protein
VPIVSSVRARSQYRSHPRRHSIGLSGKQISRRASSLVLRGHFCPCPDAAQTPGSMPWPVTPSCRPGTSPSSSCCCSCSSSAVATATMATTAAVAATTAGGDYDGGDARLRQFSPRPLRRCSGTAPGACPAHGTPDGTQICEYRHQRSPPVASPHRFTNPLSAWFSKGLTALAQFMVGEVGFEPTRAAMAHRILSPRRLPFRHSPGEVRLHL